MTFLFHVFSSSTYNMAQKICSFISYSILEKKIIKLTLKLKVLAFFVLVHFVDSVLRNQKRQKGVLRLHLTYGTGIFLIRLCSGSSN